MDLNLKIAEIITPTLEDLGFDLVRVEIMGKDKMVLQIMAEPADGRGMTVDHCADISRAVSALLDVEDPISGAYTLEVSSPGLDRPLTRAKDFVRFAGFEAKVEMNHVYGDRRRFSGKLLGFAEEEAAVRLLVDGEEVDLPFSDVKKAKLVLTDELIAAAEQQQG